MFAKPKNPSASPAPRRRSGARFDARALGDKVLAVFRRPYVAPVSAAAALVLGVIVFLNVAGDPDAASPSVRIHLDKPKAAAPSSNIAPGDQPQNFALDSLGMFGDASADAFMSANPAQGDAAVITLPGDDSGPAPAAAPKQPASPLAVAPLPSLVQTTPNGPLPIIAPNGVTPASAYARPFHNDGRPMVALIVGGLGLNPAMTKQAISELPPQVTLSFVPYANGLQGWIDLARASGHEVMIETPMQPSDYPDNDPGPQTLMANARPDDLLSHLNWTLSRATGYFALTNYQGSAFFKDRAGVGIFMNTLKQRGVDFIDDGQARNLGGAWGRASADRIIDNQLNATAIAAQLSGLEATAKSRGQALGTGFAYPVTVAVAIQWTQGLNARGLQLAPASALTH
ncbi:MAG TPA: divergent polysaccharide deacetylase family protein [Asticcacaulis sp.]